MQSSAVTLDEKVTQEFPGLKPDYKTIFDQFSNSWTTRTFGEISPLANAYVSDAHRFAKEYLIKEFCPEYQKLYDLFDSVDTFGNRKKLSPPSKTKLETVRKLFREIGFDISISAEYGTRMIQEIHFFGESSLPKYFKRVFNNPNAHFVKYHTLFAQLAQNLDQITKEADILGVEGAPHQGYFAAISQQAQRLSTALKTKLVEYMPQQYQQK